MWLKVFRSPAHACQGTWEAPQGPGLVLYYLDPYTDAALANLAELAARTKVLVIADAFSSEQVHRLFAAGARGCALRSATLVEMCHATAEILKGRAYLDPRLATAVFPPVDAKQPSGAKLTRREGQILQLVAEGYTNREISDMLLVSVRTVETHRKSIHSKLGARSRSELMRIARRDGLIVLRVDY